jgi:hypothetical protein
LKRRQDDHDETKHRFLSRHRRLVLQQSNSRPIPASRSPIMPRHIRGGRGRGETHAGVGQQARLPDCVPRHAEQRFQVAANCKGK